MSLVVSIYTAILFFILTPSILLRLPPNGNKYVVAAVHAVVFAIIFYFTHKLVWRFGMKLEGMETIAPTLAKKATTMPSLSTMPTM